MKTTQTTQTMQFQEMIYEEEKELIHEMVDRVLDRTATRRLYSFMRGLIESLEERNKKSETLKELRGSKSKKEVAKDLDISVCALTGYEEGSREPRDEVKKRMTEYYGTTYIKFAPIIKNAALADQSKESCI